MCSEIRTLLPSILASAMKPSFVASLWVPRLALLLLVPAGALGNCAVPTKIKYAILQDKFLTQNNFPVGTVVAYSCHPGYAKVPGTKNTITCLENSKWSEAEEFCKAKSCGNPGEPSNGRLHAEQGFLYGAKVTFSCNEGYRLIGRSTRQCVYQTETGLAWTHAVPHCERIPCLPPPDIDNGRHTGRLSEDFGYGSAVTYSCNPVQSGQDPYSLIGDRTISCIAVENEGVWSGSPPQCKVVKCKNVEVKNGMKVSGFGYSYKYGDTITFECKSGYYMVGQEMIQCSEKNEWLPSAPTCEKVTQDVCGAPVIANGSVSPLKDHYVVGDAITLKCNVNNAFSNGAIEMSVSCIGGNKWNPPVEACILSQGVCIVPEVSNGTISPWKAQYEHGDVIIWTCDDNYTLPAGMRKMNITCTDARWDPPFKECQMFTASPDTFGSVEISKGTIASGKKDIYVVGDTIVIECYTGYTLHGEPVIRYIGAGTWKPKIPSCELSVYIIIILALLVAGVLIASIWWIYKKFIQPKGSYKTNENIKEAVRLNLETPRGHKDASPKV
uniref:Sushi domain-containing protein n=1 Tax=Sphenodon punctatus TaxID=8508 RepID=A0A8D0H9U9_SPHPU